MKSILQVTLLIALLIQISNSTSCTAGCESCSSYNVCTDCFDGYALMPSDKCTPCPQGCSTCIETAGEFFCTGCLDDYQFTVPAKCIKCSPNCQSCYLIPENCSSCYFGEFPVVENISGIGEVTRCEEDSSCFASDCAVCSNISAEICDECMYGFYNFQGVCLECQFPCGRCDYPFRDVYFDQVVPFIEELKYYNSFNFSDYNFSDYNFSDYNFSDFNFSDFNFSDFNFTWPPARRLLSSLPPLDIMTMDLYNTSEEEYEFIILGKIMYDIVMIKTDFQADPTQAVVGVQQTVNVLRSERYISEDDKIDTIKDAMEAVDIFIEREQLKQLFHEEFLRFTVCEECYNGYRKVFNDTNKCEPCNAGCLQCDETHCLKCSPSYTLSMDNLTCMPCLYPCYECQNGDQTQCSSCQPPYKLNEDGDCTNCNNPCTSCSSIDPDSCITCSRPYSKYASSGTCYYCLEATCLVCNQLDPATCYDCIQGLVEVNGQCQKCPQNCENCDTTACYKCNEGFSLNDDNQCFSCEPGCLSCESEQICTVCHDGLYLNEDEKCELCPEECETCDEDQECILYADGKVKFGDIIADCWPGCKECSYEDPAICEDCEEGYYLEGDYCEPCSPGCEDCSTWDNCTTCGLGFVQVAGHCEPCHETCLECQPFDVDECTKCRRGLTLDGTDCITFCPKQCIQCNPVNPDICYECQEGFGLSTGVCVKCLGSCSGYCDPKDITVCLGCAKGFQLEDNECVRCPDGCTDCFDGECFECLPGFYIDLDDDDKLFCAEACKFPCEECDEDDVCSSCLPGYELRGGECRPDLSCNPDCDYCVPGTIRNNATNECQVCADEKCAACDGSTCFACYDGFYVNEDGDCEECSGNCEICLNEEVCFKCNDGYLLEIASETDSLTTYGTQCTACADRCLTCVFESDICTSCHDDFKLNGTTCVGLFVVGFRFKFDADFAEFLENSEAMVFIETLIQILSVAIEDIVLNSLTEGSIDVSGVISASSADDAADTSSSLSGATDSVGTSLGYSVISSDVNVYYNDQVYEEQDGDGDETTFLEENVGLIVGVTVGAIVVIAIVIFVVYKYKKKTSEGQLADESEIDVKGAKQQIEVTRENLGHNQNQNNIKVLYD